MPRPKSEIVKPGEALPCPRVELIEGPDDLGRYHYSRHWMADYHPGHPDGEYARRERAQHFFCVPPDDLPQLDRRTDPPRLWKPKGWKPA